MQFSRTFLSCIAFNLISKIFQAILCTTTQLNVNKILKQGQALNTNPHCLNIILTLNAVILQTKKN